MPHETLQRRQNHTHFLVPQLSSVEAFLALFNASTPMLNARNEVEMHRNAFECGKA